MPLKLPPLNALKAFEASARTGSYVTAAEELHVTPAAVSQQVRNLESFFGKQLFVRYNNRIVLTDAGGTIYRNSAPALQGLSRMTRQVLEGTARAHLVVSVVPSLAQCWFIPRLTEQTRQTSGISIETRVEDDPVDFARDDIDLRICYGAYLYPDFEITTLFRDAVVPMCSPSFAHQHQLNELQLADLPDKFLLHTNWGSSYASRPGWANWFDSAGISRSPHIADGHQFNMSSIALQCAVLGMGVVLGQLALATPDLRAKRLVALSDKSLQLGHAYCAVRPHTRTGHSGLQKLLDSLIADTDFRQQESR